MEANGSTAWRQVGACMILLAVVGMIAATYGVLAMPLAEEFKPTRMVLMLSMTIMSAVSALLSPILGNLMDKASLRLMMFVGGVFLVTGYLALSFAQSFNQVLMVFGLFMAPANILLGPIAATVLLSRWFVERRGRAMGIAIAGIALGGFVFPMIIQGLLDAYSWREAFRWLALIIGLLIFPAIALVINWPTGAQAASLASAKLDRDDPTSQTSARSILSDPTFWLIAVVIAVVVSGMKGMITNLVPLATGEGVSPQRAAMLISVYAACGFTAKLVFAAVADKLPPRLLLTASLGGVAAGLVMLSLAGSSYGLIALGVGMIGLFGGLMVPMESLLVPKVFGTKVVGRVSGLLNLVLLCWLLVSPPLFGLIYDITGKYDAILIVFAGLSLAAILLLPYIRLSPRTVAQSRF